MREKLSVPPFVAHLLAGMVPVLAAATSDRAARPRLLLWGGLAVAAAWFSAFAFCRRRQAARTDSTAARPPHIGAATASAGAGVVVAGAAREGESASAQRLARRFQNKVDRINRRTDLLQRILPDPLLVLNAGGRVVGLNPAAERELGYRRRELRGRPMGDCLLTAESAPAVAEALRDLVAAPADRAVVGPLPVEVRRGDGTVFPAELTAAALRFGESASRTELVLCLKVGTSTRAVSYGPRPALAAGVAAMAEPIEFARGPAEGWVDDGRPAALGSAFDPAIEFAADAPEACPAPAPAVTASPVGTAAPAAPAATAAEAEASPRVGSPPPAALAEEPEDWRSLVYEVDGDNAAIAA